MEPPRKAGRAERGTARHGPLAARRYDLEHEVYDALVRFRCAPWFDAYLRSRQHMGDKAAAKLPRLAGFHPLSDYLRFQPFFRKGWRGTFTDNLFVPSVWDTIVNWYFRVRACVCLEVGGGGGRAAPA